MTTPFSQGPPEQKKAPGDASAKGLSQDTSADERAPEIIAPNPLPGKPSGINGHAALAPDFEHIAPELLRIPRWVNWRLEDQGKVDLDKVPYDPKALNTRASSTDPNSWAAFAQAVTAYEERKDDPDEYSGVGIVFNGDGLVGVDIDDCVVSGVPDPNAIALLVRIGATYIETSQSGTGLHAYGYAEPLNRGCKGVVDGLHVELYSQGRFFGVTGHAVKSGPLVFLHGFGALAERIHKAQQVDDATTTAWESQPEQHDDDEVLCRMFAAENGARVRELWESSAPIFGSGTRYPSHSELDLAVMECIAFYTPNDVQAIRLFTQWLHFRPQKYRSARRVFAALLRKIRGRQMQKQEEREKARAHGEEQAKKLLAKMPPPHAGGDAANEAKPSRFNFYTVEQWAKRNLPPYRVKGLMPDGSVGAIIGATKAGKTFLLLNLMAHICAGTPWFGMRTRPGRCLYVVLEAQGGLVKRARAMLATGGNCDGLVILPTELDMRDFSQRRELTNAIKAQGPFALIAIDTLARATPGAKENNSEDMSVAVAAMSDIQQQTGAIVIAVHHFGKDESKGSRGHSNFPAALDFIIDVHRIGKRRYWSIGKAKDDEDDGPEQQFELEVVNLGADEDGDPITSCVVEQDGGSIADIQRVKMPQGGNQKVALDALRPMFKDGTTGKPGAPLLKPCIELEAAVTAAAFALPVASERRTERARAAISGLVSRGVLGCHGGWLWQN